MKTWAEMNAIGLMYRTRGCISNNPDEPEQLLREFMAMADAVRDSRETATLTYAARAALAAERKP